MNKRKTLDHRTKYNQILEEGKLIAAIAAAENEDTFKKAMVVLKFLRNNIQNKSTTQIISASADYMNINIPMENLGSLEVLAPVRQRTVGKTSNKRIRSCVEVAATMPIKKIICCGWCDNVGHNI
jgi:hypothetical protein